MAQNPVEDGTWRLRIRVGHPPFDGKRMVSVWTQDGSTGETPQLFRTSRKKQPHFLIALAPKTVIIADAPAHAEPDYLTGDVFRIEQRGGSWTINGVRIDRDLTHSPPAIGGRGLMFDIVRGRNARALLRLGRLS